MCVDYMDFNVMNEFMEAWFGSRHCDFVGTFLLDVSSCTDSDIPTVYAHVFGMPLRSSLL